MALGRGAPRLGSRGMHGFGAFALGVKILLRCTGGRENE